MKDRYRAAPVRYSAVVVNLESTSPPRVGEAEKRSSLLGVWTALIAMLVLKYLQLKSKFSWSLSNLAALLRQQLFFYRDLYVWLDDPYQAPPALVDLHDNAQLSLAITW